MYQDIFRSAPSRCTRLAFGLQFGLRPKLAPCTRTGWAPHTKRASSSPASARPRPASGGVSEIIFAANQPLELPRRLAKLSAWSISPSQMGITRHFVFPSFAAAWRFMSQVADECKVKRHHPSWSNLYNEVTVEWTTHKPQGLSIKDVEMAEFCDRVADEVGLKVQDQKSGSATLV